MWTGTLPTSAHIGHRPTAGTARWKDAKRRMAPSSRGRRLKEAKKMILKVKIECWHFQQGTPYSRAGSIHWQWHSLLMFSMDCASRVNPLPSNSNSGCNLRMIENPQIPCGQIASIYELLIKGMKGF